MLKFRIRSGPSIDSKLAGNDTLQLNCESRARPRVIYEVCGTRHRTNVRKLYMVLPQCSAQFERRMLAPSVLLYLLLYAKESLEKS